MKFQLAVLAAATALVSSAALAADTVNFTMKAHMPSLHDAAETDTFAVGIADDLERRHRLAMGEFDEMLLAVAPDPKLKLAR